MPDFLSYCSLDEFDTRLHDFSDNSDQKYLRSVCLRRDEDALTIATKLLELGHDPNGVEITSHLVAACDAMSPRMIELLILHGANPNTVCKTNPSMRGVEYETALHTTRFDYSGETCAILLNHGANLTVADEQNEKSIREMAFEIRNLRLLELIDNPELETGSYDPSAIVSDFVTDMESRQVLAPANPSSIAECKDRIGTSSLGQLELLWRQTKSLKSFFCCDEQCYTIMPPSVSEIGYDLMSPKQCHLTWERKNSETKYSTGRFLSQVGIENSFFDPGWVPFAHNGYGDYLCMDFSPSKNGQIGQIIFVGNEDSCRSLIASSLEHLLFNIADILRLDQKFSLED